MLDKDCSHQWLLSSRLIVGTLYITALIIARPASGSTIATICALSCEEVGEPVPITFEYLGLESINTPNLTLGVLGTIFISPTTYQHIGQITVETGTIVYTEAEDLPSNLTFPSESMLEATLGLTGPHTLEMRDIHATNMLISNLQVPGTLRLNATGGVVALGANITTVAPVPLPPALSLFATAGLFMFRTWNSAHRGENIMKVASAPLPSALVLFATC